MEFSRVYIEISNICNLQCSFCPEVERPKVAMDQALFASIINQVAPLTKAVCFHLMGEPLAHPLLPEFVNICQIKNVAVHVTTNGTLLNERLTPSVFSPIVKQLNFSLHSFEGNFPTKNPRPYLRKIFAAVDQALIERPDLYINFRLWNKAIKSEERESFEILKAVEEHFSVSLLPKLASHTRKNLSVKGRLSIHFDSRFQWPHLDLPLRSERGFCHGLKSHFGILVDGTVVPCCLDKEGILGLGNCKNQSLSDILNSTRAQNIRGGFEKGQLVEELCQKCSFISRFDWRLKTGQREHAEHRHES